ncbi:MAG: tRNA-dihydrouridine synthase family protein [Treponema sp.]|nr:tRNA-dihydrouridine synthase family protein [Treponema sp.]
MNLKLIAGPMATISHRAFRNIIERFGGCDEYFTEMINAGSLLANSHFEKFYIDPAPVPEKIVWQLTGHDTSKMIEAAGILSALPGLGLDLNMGCSAPDIYRFGAGISWMIKPIEETQKLVQGVGDVVRHWNSLHPESAKRFSVKLRLGDDDFTDEKFFSFTDMLIGEGVQLLTLHPRTKKEKLSRPPRYHYAEDLKRRYGGKIQVYVNGNVKDKNSFEAACKACPSVDGVMISRASVSKPWIFYQLKNYLNTECETGTIEIDMEQLALNYIDDIQLYQPQEFWKTRLQRFFTYYSENFKFGHYAQSQWINADFSSENNEDLRARIRDFFEKCPDERVKIL